MSTIKDTVEYLKNNTFIPHKNGNDMLYGLNVFGCNSIIIDFGTATTFDVIIKDTYVGGMITPGINLSLKVLKEATAKLPFIKLKKTSKFIDG